MVSSDNKKWFALALILAVQFMVILDIAIVNVALPSIQTDLGFSQENLQWVISAYALVFGGFLLLGDAPPTSSGAGACSSSGPSSSRSARSSAGSRGARRRSLPSARSRDSAPPRSRPPRSPSSSPTFKEGRERNIALGGWGAVGGVRRRVRRPLRRDPRRIPLVALDLLRERPGRRRCADPRSVPPLGEPGQARPGASTRSARSS